MRIKKLLVLCGIISAITLTGCNDSNETSDNKKLESLSNTSSIKNELPDDMKVLDKYKDFSKVNESQEYNFDTDNQYSISIANYFAESEDAMYLFTFDSILFCFDKSTNTFSHLCGKPECTHDTSSEECDAYMYGMKGIQYYEGCLYSIVGKEIFEDDVKIGEEIWLCKISLDGRTREDIFKIATCYDTKNLEGEEILDNTFSINFIVHRGYMYYIYNYGTGTGVNEALFYNNNSNILFRVKLDGSEEPQCIMKMQVLGDYNLTGLKAKGSYVYFINPDRIGYGELFRLNTEANVVEKMNIGVIAYETFTLMDEDIVYKKDAFEYEIYTYNPMTDEEKLLVEMPQEDGYWCGELYADKNYIYVNYYEEEVFQKGLTKVIDKSGNIVEEYSLMLGHMDYKAEAVCGMNEYVYMSTDRTSPDNEIYYYKKETLGKDEFEIKKGK